MHESVYEVAGNDRTMTVILRNALTGMARGSDPALRDLARDVLDGAVDLRKAAMSTVYDEALGEKFDEFWSAYQKMDPAEREALLRQTREHLDQLTDSLEAPKSTWR